jgi:probable F420-dependent oxidoreductase
MSRIRIGVQLHPQHTSYAAFADAVRRVEELGVDTIWNWDHFFPLYGGRDGDHLEGWTTLAALGAETRRARVGCLVLSMSYRNPALLSQMARTLDHVTGGRLILGVGAGWFERDYDEYGYEFGETRDRVRLLKEALPRIKRRIERLKPGPAGPMPLLIAGAGEQVMLRLVAEHAQMWNAIGSPEEYAHKSAVLEEWCGKLGRNAAEIERTANVGSQTAKTVEQWLKVGLQHFVVRLAYPFETKDLERLLKIRDS